MPSFVAWGEESRLPRVTLSDSWEKGQWWEKDTGILASAKGDLLFVVFLLNVSFMMNISFSNFEMKNIRFVLLMHSLD